MEHIKRSFSVSLQLRHPKVDPGAITTSLVMAPRFQYRVGDQRRRPDGIKLEGLYPNTYWTHPFDLVDAVDLVPFLEGIIPRLETHRVFFNSFNASGGTVELFCRIVTDSNWDELIPHQLLSRLAALQIGLRLDAYFGRTDGPNRQRS
jgi:hypothetical protein